MVFVNEAWNGTGEIVVYSNYHKEICLSICSQLTL